MKNTNAFAVPFTWKVYGVPVSGDPISWDSFVLQQGTGTATANADTIFASPTVPGFNPAAIFWTNSSPLGFGFWVSLSTTAACAAPVRINPHPGSNVNLVSGTGWPGGDPFLQRQNEPSTAFSTRNSQHLMTGANDYRTVDLPFPNVNPDDEEYAGDAWLGLFKSFDGAQTWQSTLLPGYPQDSSAEGLAFKTSVGAFDAGADPIVRAGTSGLFYYAGIAFNRPPSGTPTEGALFVARFIDLNNKENGDATQAKDPIRFLGAAPAAFTSPSAFVDKPAMAVDIPRGAGTCTLSVPQGGGFVPQTIPAGNVYLAYSAISGSGSSLQGTVFLTRSTDCGATWSAPIPVSGPAQAVSQGASLAVDPATGNLYVAWRQFASGAQLNAINVVKVTNGGTTVGPVTVVRSLPSFNAGNPTAATFFDQGTTGGSFRTNAYPALAADGAGRVYLAFAQRQGAFGDARVLLTTSTDGIVWSMPAAIDDGAVVDDMGSTFSRGHQVMPQLTFNGGRLTAVYYDLRLDHTLGLFTAVAGFPQPDAAGRFELETRALCSAAPGAPCAGEAASQVFTPFIDDTGLTLRRHTLDLRIAQAGPAATPLFTSRRLSQYKFGTRGDETSVITYLQQLQVNPGGLPMFQLGSVPFIGDYIDIAGVPFLQPSPGGPWAFNTSPSKAGTQFAAWTSNQDVVPPYDPVSNTVDWSQYTPPRSALNAGNGSNSSIFDSGQTVPVCGTPFTGSRNQNIYGALITQDFLFSSPQNSKPLSTTLQRAFVVVAQNLTNFNKSFRLVILSQPPGGWASFTPGTNQPLAAPSPKVTTLDLAVAAHSSASRSVFATSSSATAPITVNIAETSAINGPLVVNGLTGFTVLNGDASVPGLTPPDGVADGGTIATIEVYAPNVTNPNVTNPNVTNPNVTNSNVINPNVTNPNVTNPNVTNPNVTNADIANPNVTNPNVTNPNVTNPNVTNPNVTNPNVTNPNVTNPNVTNVNPSDASYTVTNTGNTTASYRVALVGSVPAGVQTQLIITKSYKTNAAQNCELFEQNQELLIANILNPTFTPPGANLNDPAILDPGIGNPTVALKPNESATVTIRAYTPPQTLGTIVTGLTPVVVPQAPNTNDPTNTPKGGAPGGTTITGGLQILTASLPDAIIGTPYAATLAANGGTAPYSWDITGGTTPAGISPLGTGSITGTPLGPAGTSAFTTAVFDSAAGTTTRPLSIRVASPLVSVAAALPGGTVGVAYAASVSATGGIVPVSFSLLSGSLPAGLSLSAGGGITGAPIAAGTSNFILRLEDSANPPQTATQSYSITVVPGTPPLLTLSTPLDVVGGETFFVNAHLEDATATPIPGAQISIDFAAKPCADATLGGSTLAVTNAAGNAQFSLTIDRGQIAYGLLATVVGNPLVTATTGSFQVQGFCDTGSLSSARKWHTATPLSDGRVLVAGGFNAGGALVSAEIYDGGLGTFSPTGSMGTPRAFHSATLLPDGKVLIVGGGSDFEAATVNTAELYDPIAGTFSPTGSLTGNTRQMHGAALLNDGRVLIAGGFTNDSGIGGLDTAELYDPVAGTFSAAAGTMVHNRLGDFTTTLLPDGRVLLTGGFQNFVGGPAMDGELFDPATATFSAASNTMSTFRGKHTGTLLSDGRVLLAGGENDTGFLASTDLFDPSSSTFAASPATMAITREAHTASRLANGKILMTGGQTLVGSPVVLGGAELYDPTSGSLPGGPLVIARQLHTATPLFAGDFLIVGGAGSSGSVLSAAEIFFPSVRLIIATTSIPTGFQDHPYPATLLTAVGTPPYVWTAMAPLPPGLVLTPSGLLAGTPSVSGPRSVWVRVTDAAGSTAFAAYPLFVATSTATDGPVTISGVSIDGGGNEAVALAGSTVNVSLSYTIADDACPACIEQIPIGFADSVPTTCAYDGIPGPTPGVSGSTVVTLTAPSTPGRYYIGFDRSAAFNCSGALGFWWNGRPGPDRYIGAIDVIDPNATNGAVTITNASVNGLGRSAVVTDGSTYSLGVDFHIVSDVTCPGCIDQIELGLTTGLPETCAFNGTPGVSPGITSSATVSLTAPSIPGRYSIGFDRSQHFSCAQAIAIGAWWNSRPGASRTIAVIVVPEPGF